MTAGDEAGFTLLELLVAIAVAALLAVLVGQGLRTGVLATERARDHALATQDRAGLETVLRSRIGLAQPLVDPDDREGAIRFVGDPSSIALVVLGPNGPVPGRITIGGDGLLSLGGRFGGDLTFALGRGAVFTYFGRRRGDPAPGWTGRWERQRELPDLVRLSLPGGATIDVRPRHDRAPFR